MASRKKKVPTSKDSRNESEGEAQKEIARLEEAVADAARRLAELEQEQERKKQEYQVQARSLAVANVNSARLIAEIEEKNEQLEHLLSEVDRKNSSLEDARRMLENSFDEVKKQHALQEIETKRMEAELDTARAVQAMLIPERVSTVSGLDVALSYRSASECGGDWLGCFEDPETNQIAVLIGDVTGHGVGSALMTAGVFSYFSTVRTLHQTPGNSTTQTPWLHEPVAILQHLDYVISAMGKSKTFMTLFASVIDYRRKTVRFSNAGHCFPFVISRANYEANKNRARKRPASLSLAGKILGYPHDPDGELRYASREVKLEPEDIIFWYTDGILENRNAEGEPIGERRLHDWLFALWEMPAEVIKTTLEQNILAFLGKQPLEDDIAFIVARAPR